MAGRLADLQEIESWLGEDTVREGILKRVDIDRPGQGDTVAVRVVTESGSAVATLNWSGFANVVTDIILTVPSSRMNSFDPKQALATIPTVSDSDKHILETRIQLALKPEKRAPAVISISVVKAPTEAYRVVSELKATLGRAMSRRTTGWHGDRAVEMKAADCAAIAASADSNCARTLGPRHKWPKTLRFIVERPSGSSFSDELAAALKEAGFLVVPDPRFENTDTCGWLASRNSDHLHEIRQFMNSARNDATDPESEDWGDRVDRAIDEKIRRLGDVYSHECDWKWFDPEAHAAEIRRCLGFRVRWEHFDEYRAGSYRFRLTVPA